MSEELEKKLDLELDEAKATGEDSESADAVTPEGGNNKKRKADKAAPAEKAETVSEEEVVAEEEAKQVAVAEAFAGLFEGTDLSEEVQTKITAVFEAAVHEKVLAEKAQLEEQFEQQLEEQVQASIDDLVEKVDSYLDYVIENWMKENEVAIESNIKVEVAESLLGSIKGLVAEHNLEIDDQTVDMVAEMEEKLEESTAKYNDVVEQMMAIKEEKKALELQVAFSQIAEGLTETQVEKLSVLAEGITFDSVEDYSAKVVAIKDNYFTESVTIPEDQTELLEEVVEEEAPKAEAIDPMIARYAESLGRFAKN